MGSETSPYAVRYHAGLDQAGGYYSRHVDAMTRFGLHSKSDIAGELAWRDYRIAELENALRERGEVAPELREFARWALTESSFSGMDLDGGSVQDKAMELGLLVRREATKPCGDNCSCADFGFPSWCYRFAPLLEAAPAGERSTHG